MKGKPLLLEGIDYWRDGLQLVVNREHEQFTLPLHAHDFIEINYVAQGEGLHYIGNERLTVRQQNIFVLPVGTSHVYRPKSPAARDELIVYNCLIGIDLLVSLCTEFPMPENLRAVVGLEGMSYKQFNDPHGDVRRIMDGFHKEYVQQKPGYEAYLLGCLTQLLLTLYRLGLQQEGTVRSFPEIRPVLQFIDVHYQERITLKQAADLIPVSISHLQRLFKAATDQSFTEYVQNVRIDKSCELLEQTRLSIGDISRLAGYRDIKFFYPLFKKKTGLSPLQYRKRLSPPHTGDADFINIPAARPFLE
ncbi:MAG: helix-turn-helix domain-containing protein [Candidatus Pristimantibacillus sp.]